MNPHFKSKFATFDKVVDTIKPILAKHNLAFIQPTSIVNDETVVKTVIIHSSGEMIESSYPIRPISQKPQDYGAALSYARRYALTSILGISADDDDDGNAASGRGNPKEPKEKEETDSEIKSFARVFQPHKPPQVDFESQKFPDEISPNGAYVVTFGKYLNKKIVDISKDDLRNYLKYINENAAASNKPVTGKAADFCKHAEAYLLE